MSRTSNKLDAELAELEQMSPAQLKAHWTELKGGPSPGLPPSLQRRLLAQELQERRLGRLPAAVIRELERADGSTAAISPKRVVPLTIGARLVREWNGQTITVEVREEGFWWKERSWRSLTQIAYAVTGARWSGPRFFGLLRHG